MQTTTTSETVAMTDLIAFAGRFNLTPAQAVVLPALFDKAASECGMSRAELVAVATYRNIKAGEYLASVARTVAEKVAA